MVTRKTREPVVLGKKEEDILKAMRFYRYMTALDVCYLLYKPTVLTEVRRVLSELSGRADFVEKEYLYRFRMPDIGRGNPERIYTLGARGRELLVSEFGLPVDWYFRPGKAKHMNYSQLMHNLLLTRFLVSLTGGRHRNRVSG